MQLMLEKLPSMITIGTLAALCLAVSHEWAYYGVIGGQYQTLYTTSDYIALTIWGSGAAFLTIVVVGLIQFVAFRSDNFTVPPFSEERTFGGFLDRNFFFILASLSALSEFFFGTSQVNLWAYVLMAFIVLRGLSYILHHEKTKQYDTGWVSILIHGLPCGMIILFGIGRYSAYVDISNKEPHYELRLKDQYVSRNVDVLRFLERGALIFDPKTGKVEFLKTDVIARVTRKTPELDDRSFACKHWQVCPVQKRSDAPHT